MSENTEEKKPISDDEIVARAHEIKAEQGCTLVDAMILAEEELTPKAAVPSEFTVTIEVKPRVAKWIASEFAPRDGFSTEDRLAAFLAVVLNRSRVTAMREAKDAPEIQEGRAVTMSRRQFQQKAPKE